MATDEKILALEARLRPMGGLLVALSGGVDSSLLLAAAARVGASPLLAVTVSSAMQPDGEVAAAREVAESLGVAHRVAELDPLADPAVADNGPDRCYHCKRRILAELLAIAEDEGGLSVVEGSNLDDGGDYRPGRRAVAELGVASPLAEAGLGKADIRRIARDLGLAAADRPSAACLASRVPYGTPLDEARLRRVDRAEAAARSIIGGQLRVRDHFPLARVEVEPERIPRAAEPESRARLVAELKAAGYAYVTLDLIGYRTGAMNEVLRGDEGDGGGAQ